MDLRQLRYFSAIVAHGSITRAAAALGVAQPALSTHLRNMEARLGRPLLIRGRAGVTPTEAGALLAARAERVLQDMARLEEDLRDLDRDPAGAVHVGLPGTVAEIVALPLIQAVSARYPRVRLTIAEAMSGFIGAWLAEGRVDIGVQYGPSVDDGILGEKLLEEELAVIWPGAGRGGAGEMRRGGLPDGGAEDGIDVHVGSAGRGDGLAERGGAEDGSDGGQGDGSAGAALAPVLPGAPPGVVELDALQDAPMVLPSGAHGLRALVEAACARLGFAPRAVVEIDSYANIKRLVAAGHGASVLPLHAVRAELAAGALRASRVAPPGLRREAWLAWPAPALRPPSRAQEAVRDTLREVILSLAETGAWADVRPVARR